MSALPLWKGTGLTGSRGTAGSVELLEEYEAIRLADYENSHEEAAQRMNISRPTFTRLYDKARKHSPAFIESKSIVIRGGIMKLTITGTVAVIATRSIIPRIRLIIVRIVIQTISFL